MIRQYYNVNLKFFGAPNSIFLRINPNKIAFFNEILKYVVLLRVKKQKTLF